MKVLFVNEIASRNNIPKKFLGRYSAGTAQRRYSALKKGPNGGYGLAKPASDIMIGEVVARLDGPLAPIRCASRTALKPAMIVPIRKPVGCLSMTEVRDAIAMILDNMSLAEFVSKKATRCWR